MLKPAEYDSTTIGGYTPIELGGKLCQIIEVKEYTSTKGNPTLAIYFDFDQNDTQTGWFRKTFDNDRKKKGEKAKWRGIYYIALSGQYSTVNLKRFTSAVEQSNPGFITKFDQRPGEGTFVNSFKGKKIGFVFGQEEYRKPDGTIGRTTKPFKPCDYNKAKDSTVPQLKRLKNDSGAFQGGSEPNEEGFYQVDMNSDVFPFN